MSFLLAEEVARCKPANPKVEKQKVRDLTPRTRNYVRRVSRKLAGVPSGLSGDAPHLHGVAGSDRRPPFALLGRVLEREDVVTLLPVPAD